MNKKQIETRIREESNKVIVPDLKQEILAQVPNRGLVEKKNRSIFTKRVSLALSYLSIFLVVALSIFLLAKYNLNHSQNSGVTENNEPSKESTSVIEKTPVKNLSNVKKSYAKQAATLAGFAGSFTSTPEVGGMSTLLGQNKKYQDIAELLNEYYMKD